MKSQRRKVTLLILCYYFSVLLSGCKTAENQLLSTKDTLTTRASDVVDRLASFIPSVTDKGSKSHTLVGRVVFSLRSISGDKKTSAKVVKVIVKYDEESQYSGVDHNAVKYLEVTSDQYGYFYIVDIDPRFTYAVGSVQFDGSELPSLSDYYVAPVDGAKHIDLGMLVIYLSADGLDGTAVINRQGQFIWKVLDYQTGAIKFDYNPDVTIGTEIEDKFKKDGIL